MRKNLEYSDLASPGAHFSRAAASMKTFKASKDYRDQLRALACLTVPARATAMARRDITSLQELAEAELAVLRTGAAPDIFHGVIHFAPPQEDV